MGWGDVEKGALGQGSGRFLTLEDGETKTIRLLDEEPETAYSHRISQIVNGQEVYRSIPATVDLDDNYIQNNSRRWPAMPVHGMRCIEIDGGEPVGDILVLTGGKQIFSVLKQLYDRHGDLRQYDIEIHREGEKRDTKYTVTMAPRHAEIDLEELYAEIEEDEAIQWDAIFPKINGEQQQRMLQEAGLSIEYDPAEDIASGLKLEESLDTRMDNGKYKGKSMRELVVIDAGYLTWVANNYTSSDTVAAAARVVVRNMDQLAAPTKRAALGTGKKAAEPKAAAASRATRKETKAAAPDQSVGDRQEITAEINELLAADPRFEDAMEIARVIGEHGGGKTRMRDLTVDQLLSLRDSIRDGGGETDTPAPAAAGRRRRGK